MSAFSHWQSRPAEEVSNDLREFLSRVPKIDSQSRFFTTCGEIARANDHHWRTTKAARGNSKDDKSA
jgi:hypothetical protein